MKFVDAARACAAGTITFRQFMGETDRRWQWWAKRLARAGIPAWLDTEDIRQELLVEAWRALRRYDSEKAKGQSPAQFTEFAAKYHAKKQVHRARGDDRHTWEWGPAKFEIPMSAFSREGDEEENEVFDIPIDADQDRAIERKQSMMILAREQGNLRDFFGVQALAEAQGDIEEAARMLWEDLDMRLLCRLPSDHAARLIVGRLASGIAA